MSELRRSYTRGPWAFDLLETQCRIVQAQTRQPVLSISDLVRDRHGAIPQLLVCEETNGGPPWTLTPVTADHPDARLLLLAPTIAARAEAVCELRGRIFKEPGRIFKEPGRIHRALELLHDALMLIGEGG